MPSFQNVDVNTTISMDVLLQKTLARTLHFSSTFVRLLKSSMKTDSGV